MHFPLFQIPLFSKTIPNFTFSRKIYRFSSAKISDDLFQSSTTNLEFPLFISHVSVHLPRCFAKIIIPPYFYKFPLLFEKNYVCFHTLCVFRFSLLLPCMTHLCITHTMQVLDAPVNWFVLQPRRSTLILGSKLNVQRSIRHRSSSPSTVKLLKPTGNGESA